MKQKELNKYHVDNIVDVIQTLELNGFTLSESFIENDTFELRDNKKETRQTIRLEFSKPIDD